MNGVNVYIDGKPVNREEFIRFVTEHKEEFIASARKQFPNIEDKSNRCFATVNRVNQKIVKDDNSNTENSLRATTVTPPKEETGERRTNRDESLSKQIPASTARTSSGSPSPNKTDSIRSEGEKKMAGRKEPFVYKQNDYAFAYINKINLENQKCYFSLMSKDEKDGLYFSRPYEEVRGILGEPALGMKCWCYLISNPKDSEEGNRFLDVEIYGNNKPERNIFNEFRSLFKNHRNSEEIGGVIRNIVNNKLIVEVGPTATVEVLHDQYGKYKKGDYRFFDVQDFYYEDGRYKLDLLIKGRSEAHMEKLYSLLPDKINDPANVLLPYDTLRLICDSKNILAHIVRATRHVDGMRGEELLAYYLNERYQVAKKKKAVRIKRGKIFDKRLGKNVECYYMDFMLDDVLGDKGVPYSVGFRRKVSVANDNKWVMNFFMFAKDTVRKVFERDIYVKDWQRLLWTLEERCLGGEDWEYEFEPPGNRGILRRFFQMSYYKSWLDGLVMEKDGYAVFNTGLVDGLYDDIYCCLKRNDDRDDFWERKWVFDSFFKAEETAGKRLNKVFPSLPDAPSYFPKDKRAYSLLVFNYTKTLNIDFEHIIMDNVSRLPIEFIAEKLGPDKEARALAQKAMGGDGRAKWLLYEKVKSSDFIKYLIISGMKEAVTMAQKKCRWNYKTAIPVYYPRNNQISLLLPLKLCYSDESQPADIALVVEYIPETDTYQGQTILTLSMAYQDARQLCRPDSEWLTTKTVRDSAEEDGSEDED